MSDKPRSKISVRLLPLLALILLLVLGLHVGRAWKDFGLSFGSRSEAQSAQPTPPAATGTAADNSAAATTAPSTENAVSPGSLPPSTANDVPGEVVSGLAAPINETTGVTPIDASTTNAAATSENGMAQTGPETTPPPDKINDPLDLSDEEIDVLQQLAKRREELEVRSRRLDEREALVVAAEGRMEQKMVELKALQSTVEGLLNQRSAEEEAQLKSLVKIYENMKPKAAAQVFEELDLDVLLGVVSRMNERKLAPILALVSTTRAKEVTYELAQRHVLPLTP